EIVLREGKEPPGAPHDGARRLPDAPARARADRRCHARRARARRVARGRPEVPPTSGTPLTRATPPIPPTRSSKRLCDITFRPRASVAFITPTETPPMRNVSQPSESING